MRYFALQEKPQRKLSRLANQYSQYQHRRGNPGTRHDTRGPVCTRDVVSEVLTTLSFTS
jgi:hypothetical protein